MGKKLDFEGSLDRLDEIVALLESEQVTLDASIALFAEGVKLLAFCKEAVTAAELKIEELVPFVPDEIVQDEK